ncbi:MAG TPA: plasmid pRiA4b ORF-3 family protein, partial [Candidatus Ozemobacteraceae bacterium]|nr:plasmid pRiA4b ORF-3 family protein [Candidatus Ozemobacteraceae bacterium]
MNDSASGGSAVVRLRLEITGLSPSVWRLVDIQGNILLPELHKVIQAAMGWRNEYPACFVTPAGIHPIGEWPEAASGPASRTLAELLDNPKREFAYDYEPDEPWRVICRLESERPREAGDGPFPCCVDGARSAPPDGVGGREGYADFLRMLDDPD